MGPLRLSQRRGPATSGNCHPTGIKFVSELTRNPRTHSRVFSPLQNSPRESRSISKEVSARAPRQRSNVQLERNHSQCRSVSGATWDQPLEVETAESAPLAEGAPGGTISTRGAVINTLNIMVCTPISPRSLLNTTSMFAFHSMPRCSAQSFHIATLVGFQCHICSDPAVCFIPIPQNPDRCTIFKLELMTVLGRWVLVSSAFHML